MVLKLPLGERVDPQNLLVSWIMGSGMKVKAFIFYAAALLILGSIFAWVILNTQSNINSDQEKLYPSLVVARVDGVEILAEEVNRLVNLGSQIEIPDRAEQRRMQRQALEDLIRRQLVINEGKRRSIEVSSAELEELMQQYFEMNGGEERILEQLRQSNQTLDDMREELHFRILLEKIITSVEPELRDSVEVSESEIDTFYNERLISTYTKMEIDYLFVEMRERDEDHKDKALELTEEMIKELDEGQSFEELVGKHTDIDGIRVRIGKFKETDQVSDILRTHALKLDVGEHTREPIEFINSGYQILKCLSKRVVPLDEARESIEQRLRDVKVNDAVTDYFNNLRDRAEIEIFLK